MPEALHHLGVKQALQGLREGRFTSEALVRDCLTHIARLDPKIEAWAWLKSEAALETARSADHHRRAGKQGVLLGVPVAIKDIIDVRGVPTRMGSPVFEDNIPSTSARVVRRWEEAGAVLLGKTVTAELAYFSPGKTRNPWNPAHTPGGADAAVVASALIGHTPDDTDSLSDFALVPQDLDPKPLFQPPRLAAVRSPVWHLADADQQENFLQSVATLRRAGTAVEAAVLPDAFQRAHDVHRTIMYYEGARTFAALQDQHRERLSAELNRLIDDGAKITEAAYYAALESRTRLQGELGDFLRRYDAVLPPPPRGEAPATLAHTGDPAFCTLWTLCGVPALTIPSGLGAHGMPLGLQLVGGYLQDARLLQVALWCEEAIGFRHS